MGFVYCGSMKSFAETGGMVRGAQIYQHELVSLDLCFVFLAYHAIGSDGSSLCDYVCVAAFLCWWMVLWFFHQQSCNNTVPSGVSSAMHPTDHNVSFGQ